MVNQNVGVYLCYQKQIKLKNMTQTISQIAETTTGTITSIQSTQKGFLGTTIYTMVVDTLGDVYTSTKKPLKVGQKINFVANVKVNDNGNDFGKINLRIL